MLNSCVWIEVAIAQKLEKEGYVVRLAKDGMEAIAAHLDYAWLINCSHQTGNHRK
jgi:hypothetical protein